MGARDDERDAARRRARGWDVLSRNRPASVVDDVARATVRKRRERVVVDVFVHGVDDASARTTRRRRTLRVMSSFMHSRIHARIRAFIHLRVREDAKT